MERAESDAVRTALRVLETAMPGAVIEPVDPGGGPTPLRDFDILMEGRDPIALEVTTSTRADLLQTRARFAEQLATPIEAPQLRWSWHLYAEVRADVRRIRREIVPALAELESEWSSSAPPDLSFFGPTSAARSTAVRRLWQSLGIIWGRAHTLAGPASVFISPPSDPREWTDAHPGAFVVEAVEAEAEKADNVRKLGESGRSERHLFVYVDPRSYPAWQDLDRGTVPPVPPRLPDVITTAWVATVGSDERDVAWSVTPPGTWEIVLGG
jgi:hypothetical protein